MTVAPVRPRLDGPTPLSLDELVELTRITAAQVRSGAHTVQFDEINRWSVRLHSDDFADVWLISWTQEQSTELHDHAGSLGALTVVSGELTERYWTLDDDGRPGLRSHQLPTSTEIGFAVGHVHDVVNTQVQPAVSVHAYSPPLTAMAYYEVDPVGSLRRTRTILTDDPEPEVPTLVVPTQASPVQAVPTLESSALADRSDQG